MNKKTEVTTNTKTVLELDNFNPVKAELIAFIDERKELKLKNLQDKEGYEKIRAARIEIKNKRTKEIEPERVKIVKPANDFVNQVNTAANEIKDIMQAAEKALQIEEDKYTAEKERLKREKEEAEQKIVQERLAKFAEWDYHPDYIFTKMLSDEQFEDFLQKAKIAFEEKKAEEKAAKEKADAEAEEQRKLAVINEARSIILNAKTHEELEKIFEFIETRNLDLNEFQNEIDAKKDAINEAKKLEEEKIKQQEEKQKLLEEKIALATEKIAAFKTLEELNNYYNSFAEHEYVQDKLLDAYNKRKNELLEEEKAKTAAAEKTPDRVVGNKVHEIKTTAGVTEEQVENQKELYKQFLINIGWTKENKDDFIIDNNKETKVVTVFKKAGVFNY